MGIHSRRGAGTILLETQLNPWSTVGPTELALPLNTGLVVEAQSTIWIFDVSVVLISGIECHLPRNRFCPLVITYSAVQLVVPLCDSSLQTACSFLRLLPSPTVLLFLSLLYVDLNLSSHDSSWFLPPHICHCFLPHCSLNLFPSHLGYPLES